MKSDREYLFVLFGLWLPTMLLLWACASGHVGVYVR